MLLQMLKRLLHIYHGTVTFNFSDVQFITTCPLSVHWYRFLENAVKNQCVISRERDSAQTDRRSENTMESVSKHLLSDLENSFGLRK